MSYPRFENEMSEWYPSYQWEALEVTTADNYILTMFHIWNDETRDSSKGPVLFQHGMEMDGVDWITGSAAPSVHIHMADLGHDIYIGNGRGTEYSMQHTTLNATTDQD